MATVEIRRVGTRGERRTFLTFPWRIYRGDPLWVPPLLPDRAGGHRSAAGRLLQARRCEFFIAWRGRQPVGTICCAEDRVANASRGWKDGVIGFFECVDDDAVAAGAVRSRGRLGARPGAGHALRAVQPGLRGWLRRADRRPRPAARAPLRPHARPTIQRFFEAYGFEPARAITWPSPSTSTSRRRRLQRLARLAERVRARGHYRVRGGRSGALGRGGRSGPGPDEPALAHLPDFMPWERPALDALLAPFRQIADPELVLFAERPLGRRSASSRASRT